jgi:hypothetical protein
VFDESGSKIMLTLEKRIQQWKKWVNRNKQFSTEELEELENHLREEILYLTEHDKVPDQKAFDQALDILGEKGLLDEEFGKIRKSFFEQIQKRSLNQWLLIFMLLLFLIVPKLPIKPKDHSQVLLGEKIGMSVNWEKKGTGSDVQNIVTNQKEVYYYNKYNNNIHCYSYQEDRSNVDNPKSIGLEFAGTYFFNKNNDWSHSYSCFDIDENNLLYKLGRNVVEIFQNSQIKESIIIPKLDSDHDKFVSLRVLNRNLVLCITRMKEKYQKEGKTVTNEILPELSYLLVLDLDSKEKKFNKILLGHPVLYMDRSENELAILSNNGEIMTFFIQNSVVKSLKKWLIQNFSEIYIKKSTWYDRIDINGIEFSLLYSKEKHHMALTNDGQFYYLKPISESDFAIVPLIDENIICLIKVNYLEHERLAVIKRDNPTLDEYFNLFNFTKGKIWDYMKYWYDNLYLFKD